MSFSNSADSDLLKSLLEPLLDDFQYWFARSRNFLESHEISFMTVEQQADLLARIDQAQQEVSAAQMLFKAMNGQVGIETAAMIPWHQIVSECWQMAIQLRLENSFWTDGQE